MRIVKIIFIIPAFLFTILSFGQPNEIKKYSNARLAIIIDSLEQVVSTSTEINKSNLLYELAILYAQIDHEQAISYAHQFINNNNPHSSVKLNDIYSLLAQIYQTQQNIDSSYYYMNLQSMLIEDFQIEKNESLKSKYLHALLNDNDGKTILGFGIFNFLIILVLLIAIFALIIYFFISKNKFQKEVAVKNSELEQANIKLQKFKDELQQAIMENTYERAIELEKTSNDIVELRKSLKKAEESNYLKNAFLGTMSHKIRTPLSGIMGFSDMLETELALKGNEDLYEFAKNIQEAGEKLMSLITNIIDISSIEANILELNISECNINELVSDIEKKYISKAREKGLIFKTKLDAGLPELEIDRVNLEKVLNVVMDNAIQYTPKGFVTLSTTYDSKLNKAIIEVKDKGISIDKDTMKMLVDSFDYTKHGSSLTYKGHGLGLILAHRLVTLMNGTLVLNSKQGVGTSVKIKLPCSSESSSNMGSNSSDSHNASIVSAPELGRLKVFVVEDDRMNRMVIEKMLKKTGDVTTSSDGKEALNKLQKKCSSSCYYDVILVDINLPAPWDGVKLLQEIRRRFPHMNNTPFIAQTAYAMSGDKDLYLDAGFNDYISKPINKNELITMIQKQLELIKKQ